jgi:hypothetical protein
MAFRPKLTRRKYILKFGNFSHFIEMVAAWNKRFEADLAFFGLVEGATTISPFLPYFYGHPSVMFIPDHPIVLA